MTSKLNQQRIVQSFGDGAFPGGVHLFETIDSTNDWSLAQIKRGRELPFVCMADHQSKGRGRRGRHWLSPSGANIYMSLAWYFESPPDKLGLLSLAVGVAVARAIKRIGINDAWLKWPNDVLIGEEKIAGVLIETSGFSTNGCNTVIGIGLNYCMPDNIDADSHLRWTDVAHAIGGTLPDRNDLVAILLNEVISMCRQYQQKMAAIFTEIKHELDAFVGRRVSVNIENGSQLAGEVLGINHSGELRLLLNGRERTFNSVDVRLTGLSTGSDTGEGFAND